VPDEVYKYLIDTDVLARIGVRKDSQSIYDGLIELAQAGQVRTVTQVFDELKKCGPVAFQALREYRGLFEVLAEQQFATDISAIIE
jgi:hypothetical protein